MDQERNGLKSDWEPEAEPEKYKFPDMGQVTGRMEHILFEIIHCTWRYITDGIGLVLYNIAGEGGYIAMIVTWPITGSSLTARLNVSAPQPAGSTLFHLAAAKGDKEGATPLR